MTGVTIRLGLPDDLREEAAQMYWRAFGPKLGRVLGPPALAHRFLMRVICAERCMVATDAAGRLLGIAGIRTADGSFAGGTQADLRAIYGPVGAGWRGFLLQLLADDSGPDRFSLDGLCVADFAQGQGIGTLLLDAICKEARQRGFPAVRLEVVDSNARAQALYRRQGFVLLDIAPLGLLRLVFRFRASHRMIRPL